MHNLAKWHLPLPSHFDKNSFTLAEWITLAMLIKIGIMHAYNTVITLFQKQPDNYVQKT